MNTTVCVYGELPTQYPFLPYCVLAHRKKGLTSRVPDENLLPPGTGNSWRPPSWWADGSLVLTDGLDIPLSSCQLPRSPGGAFGVSVWSPATAEARHLWEQQQYSDLCITVSVLEIHTTRQILVFCSLNPSNRFVSTWFPALNPSFLMLNGVFFFFLHWILCGYQE